MGDAVRRGIKASDAASGSALTFAPPERSRLFAEPPTSFEAQALTDFPARHIAIILHDFSTGGSERIAIRLANRWVQMGRRVSLYCGTEQGPARALVGPGVAVRGCSPVTIRSPLSRVWLGWRMARLVRQDGPDIVFSPGNFHLLILVVLARLPYVKRPAFVSKLSNPLRRAAAGHGRRRLIDAIIRLATAPVDMLVAMSPALRAEAQSVFPAPRLAQIAEPVLDIEQAVRRPQQPRRRAAPLILCAGRLAPQKDPLTAVRAFAELPAGLGARLVWLGDGQLRSQLMQEISRLGVGDRVSMPGHVADITPYLARADLFLLTSRYEGYPAVLVEAVAAGVPVVTTDCTVALREILSSPDLGTIAPTRDPLVMAAAIMAQLDQPPPSPEAVRRATAHHSLDASAISYLALFDRIVQ